MPVNIMGLCNPYILHYLEVSHKRHRISSYMTVSIEVFVITKFCKLLKQIRSCKRILLTNNSINYIYRKIPIIEPRSYFWSKGLFTKFFLGRGRGLYFGWGGGAHT